MKRPVHSKIAFGVALLGVFGLAAQLALAQVPVPAAAAPGAGSDIVRIRKGPTPLKEKTPVFKSAGLSVPATGRPSDWWRVMVEFETAPEWIDELEFTYYAYLNDQSNKNSPMMLRGTVTYVNVAKGRHFGDMFLHPATIARRGLVKEIAVVIKAKGVLVAKATTAKQDNWWETMGYPPTDGELLNRAQTPFAFVDYDSYEAIKPVAAAAR